jgi:hypothetical protein
VRDKSRSWNSRNQMWRWQLTSCLRTRILTCLKTNIRIRRFTLSTTWSSQNGIMSYQRSREANLKTRQRKCNSSTISKLKTTCPP